MKLGDRVQEPKRVAALVAERRALLLEVAHEGYRTRGRGAVFLCEAWEVELPEATPFYLPASEPEFSGVGKEIDEAVTDYDPETECVVVVVTVADEVYVVRLRFAPLLERRPHSDRSPWLH